MGKLLDEVNRLARQRPGLTNPLHKSSTPRKTVVYRIILDEPIGFAVGFKPDLPDAELDELVLASDDGGSYAIFDHDQGKIHISRKRKHGDYWAEPDVLIFRSQKQLNRWMKEMEY